jgi:hypothetical protein
MGGLKLHPDDQGYKSFTAWLQDYARVAGDQYTSVDDLPADNWHATQLVIRLTSVPADWPEGVPVQLFLYARDEADQTWEREPLAFTQGPVTPQRAVNGPLFLLGPQRPNRAKSGAGDEAPLADGEYQVKVYVDTKQRLAGDPTLFLGGDDFHGQTVLKISRWREGFRHAKTISGAALKE